MAERSHVGERRQKMYNLSRTFRAGRCISPGYLRAPLAFSMFGQIFIGLSFLLLQGANPQTLLSKHRSRGIYPPGMAYMILRPDIRSNMVILLNRYYKSSIHCLRGCDHGFTNLKTVATILAGGPLGEYREGIHPQQRWWRSDGTDDPDGVADDVLEMWGAERIQANTNDSDDVLLADLRRALPAVQAPANEEVDIQRALQESRESY